MVETTRPNEWLEPFTPPADLAHDVMSTWTAETKGRHFVLPDGCVDLAWLEPGEVWICGPNDREWRFERPSSLKVVGISLRPGAVARVLRVDTTLLGPAPTPLEAVMSGAEVAAISAAVAEASDRRPALIDALRPVLLEANPPSPVERIITDALTSHDVPSMGDIAEQAAVSERHLHRISLAMYGYGPTMLARIVRLQRFVRAAQTARGRSIGELAAEAGYFDHAHLCRECRQVVKRTPSQVIRDFAYLLPAGPDPYLTPWREAVA